ncbi:MAG TPA: hypothetical protein LFW13_04670, partial [Rickettsia endosymbiont of Sericostoma sp.]|nr:hypothetical protein [Rickettsia endosymbiont of Sericostoma sp.]
YIHNLLSPSSLNNEDILSILAILQQFRGDTSARNDVDHICHCETTQVGCGNPSFIRFELLR